MHAYLTEIRSVVGVPAALWIQEDRKIRQNTIAGAIDERLSMAYVHT